MTDATMQATVELKDSWDACANLWLESRLAESTRRTYCLALNDLLADADKNPWEITRTDVIRWVQSLKARELSPATIATRLAGISSFYSFAMEDFIVTDADGQRSSLATSNPAAGGKSMRPRVEMYGKSIYLSAAEAKSLLHAIGQKSVHAKRDYALFLGYLLLARRNTEWRSARWGDFDERGGHIEFKWSGKGKTDQRLEVPTPLWTAVKDFLKSAKRVKTIQPADYIFTPMKNKTPLPNGRHVDSSRPISSHEVGRLLKRYASIAGLAPEGIHPHILRHTGAMLRREVGSSPEQIKSFLGHANLATTAIYLHSLEGKDDQSWAKVSTLLGLDL